MTARKQTRRDRIIGYILLVVFIAMGLFLVLY